MRHDHHPHGNPDDAVKHGHGARELIHQRLEHLLAGAEE